MDKIEMTRTRNGKCAHCGARLIKCEERRKYFAEIKKGQKFCSGRCRQKNFRRL